MARTNFNKNNPTPESSKVKLDKNLGVYVFVDEDGNVTQISKKNKTINKFYPNETSKVDKVIGDVTVIGVNDTDAMGIGDYSMAYAIYTS